MYLVSRDWLITKVRLSNFFTLHIFGGLLYNGTSKCKGLERKLRRF